MDKQEVYLQYILTVEPTLEAHTLHMASGQFNDVVIVNNDLIFRFPRSSHEANVLAQEVAVLSKIGCMVTLPIPNPMYVRTNREVANENFTGYRMIPGEAFSTSIIDTIKDDTILARVATQVAAFMQELHTLTVKDVGLDMPIADTRDEWQDLYQQFRDILFPYM